MIIVGAGIIGLSCALRLSQRGVPVTIFDKGRAGGEASWAGAGMLAPGGECFSDGPSTRLALRSRALYPDFIRELEDESGVSIDFRECGALEISAKAGDVQSALGIESEPRSNGRFYPGDAIVDPRDVTRALAIACRKRGVDIRESEPVDILPAGSEPVLIAAGAWSSSLCPELPRVSPLRGHLIGFHMQPSALPYILRSEHTYLLQRRSGFLIAGSTTEDVGFDRSVNAEIVADIHARAAKLMPELGSRQPDEAWVGFRPAIEGDVPFIGRVGQTNIWAATGHYRNGILLAPETARLIAAQLLER